MPESKEREEDAAYLNYSMATDEQVKELHQGVLLQLMTAHAHAVCVEQLGRRRMDVVNEALARALRGMAKFRGDAKFSTWFHRICINECKRVLRAEKTRACREVSLEDLDHEPQAPAAFGEMSKTELFTKVAKLLDGDDYLFFYNKIQGYPDAWLSERFDLSPAGVRVRWFRIRKKLERLLPLG